MKILHLVGTLNAGGIERIVSQLAVSQKRDSGMTPVVACAIRREGIFLDSLLRSGIPVYDCAMHSSSPWVLSKKLNNIIRFERPDIIHSHINFSLIWQAISKNQFSIPFVFTQHSISKYSHSKSYQFRAILSYRFINQQKFRHTAVSEYAAKYAAELYRTKQSGISLIYNGIQAKSFAFSNDRRQELRSQWGVKPDQIVIGCVGRLDHVKGYDILIRAFARLLNQLPGINLCLAITGSGDLHRELVELCEMLGISKKVIWLGNSDDIPGVLSAFDLYAQASRWETLSLTILEAAANGLNVVASDTGGAIEISRHCRNIHLFPVESIEILAERLSTQVAFLPRKNGSDSSFPTQFDFNTMMRQYLDIYESFQNS